MRTISGSAATLWLVLAGSASAAEYVRDVKPILAARCYACHGALKQQSGLRLDTAALLRKGGDRIMVTAATPDLEPAWLEQLAERGLLLAPLALAPGLAYVVRGQMRDGRFQGRLTRAAYFMPLRAEGEAGQGDFSVPPPTHELCTYPAPWAGWLDRRRARVSWLGFVQALAFFGLLRGLTVHYQSLATGETTFGVSAGDDVCWLGAQNWLCSEETGRDLGQALWQAFLDAGGPWPTEYRLTATPAGGLEPGTGYLRQGERCQQRWDVIAPRDRPPGM